jgi:pimeloyl-ACP methyl ester carboxylesterase
MAEDTATLLQQLGIKKADVFGYSAGGSVALHLAVGHPKLVRTLALASSVFSMDGYLPQIAKGLRHPSPENFPPIMREDYEQVAPNPAGWSALVEKAGKQAVEDRGLLPAEVQLIITPALVMISDHDIILPEHAEELARLLHTEVVVIPNSDHASYVTSDIDFLLAKLTEFLDVSTIEEN